MSLLTLGWAAEYADQGVAANCLWPETLIATAAVQNLLGGDEALAVARSPKIVADAAVEILGRPSRECTGNTLLDVDVLRNAGVSDLAGYGGGDNPEYDIFIDGPEVLS